jgi:hypothetical protein
VVRKHIETYKGEFVVEVVGFIIAIVTESASPISLLKHRSCKDDLVPSKDKQARGLKRLSFPSERDLDLRVD